MTFKKGDRVRVAGGTIHLEGRVATVLGYDECNGTVRIKCRVVIKEIPGWKHDYWSVSADHLVLADAVTELGELVS